MLDHSGCETYDWPYAVNHSVFLRNNVRSESLTSDSTPNEIYFGVKRFDVPIRAYILLFGLRQSICKG
jgi:hypothetical protein